MKKIIINGANGFVASNFIRELLKQDYTVIALVRSSSKYPAAGRMSRALANISGGRYSAGKNLHVYAYSLLEKNFSLSEAQLSDIFSGDADYFHFAASLKYDRKSKDEIFETNVGGVLNSLNIFSKYATKNARFFFISTAYSCGNTGDIFLEKFYDNAPISDFRNYYEQSKRFAENVVRDAMRRTGINAHIIRLSQVVGDSRSGITKTDYGIFDFAKRIHALAYKYPDQTVRVKVDPDSTQNLIPVNTVVRYLFRTVERRELPVIMHFVARKSIKNIFIINSLCELLPINIIPVISLDKNGMTSMERILSVGMSFTGGYIRTNIRFDTRNLDRIASPDEEEVDEPSIFRMLEFFIKGRAGKRNNQILQPAC